MLWHGRAELTEVAAGKGYLWHGRTELTEVPGAGMNVVQNSQTFRVRVFPAELTEVLRRVTRGKYPEYGVYVPYRTPCNFVPRTVLPIFRS